VKKRYWFVRRVKAEALSMEQKIGARVDDCGIVKSLKNLGSVRSVL
jgi:hypothetical protein